MTGAITFLRHWRNICNAHRGCYDCPIKEECKMGIFTFSDADFPKLVRAVEREHKKLEAKNE